MLYIFSLQTLRLYMPYFGGIWKKPANVRNLQGLCNITFDAPLENWDKLRLFISEIYLSKPSDSRTESVFERQNSNLTSLLMNNFLKANLGSVSFVSLLLYLVLLLFFLLC